MIIDCHTHAFPDKIAEKAVAWLMDYYKIQIANGGRFADLLQAAEQARVDALILLAAATRPEQVQPANDWMLALAASTAEELRSSCQVQQVPTIFPFGAYHPEHADWLGEIRRLRDAGIKGIKLHPEFQGIDLGRADLKDFFAEIERDFILMIHIGDRNVSEYNFSTPKKVAAILDNFPKLRIIAAHMGGFNFWTQALESLAGRDVYLDTSSAMPFMPPDLFRKLVSKHGVERILFGSDYPVDTPRRALGILNRINWLSDSDKAKICGQNCAELLKIPTGAASIP